jgi:nickel/cobalt exporter
MVHPAPGMPHLPPIPLATVFGFLHALVPCVHSWPMLLPFVGSHGSVWRPALVFGAGVLTASAVAGAALGAAAGALPLAIQMRAEEITGVILVLLGLLILLRPRLGHLGHLHGDCEPGQPAHCAHTVHEPRRFGRFGRDLGLFLLGFVNLAIPCWTNVSAASLAVGGGGLGPGIAIFGAYGLASAITMTAILLLARRGFHILDRLRSGRSEVPLVRISGALLILCGLALVLHWHTHEHAG